MSAQTRRRKTSFVALFRTTPAHTVCPNFYVLAHANGCGFRPACLYCHLYSTFWYLDEPQVFSNTEALLQEVRRWIASDNLECATLNTGNLSDSLNFENLRPLMGELVELFRREAEAAGRPHILLAVTKAGMEACRPFLERAPCRNVVISFSVNAPEAAHLYELGAAVVEDRLEAAARLKAAGWRVRIRIDPMIAGFDYAWIAAQVAALAPERVTLGALRAEPNLLRRLPRAAKELFSRLNEPDAPKGLARYPEDLRLALYRQALARLDGASLGLCEETPEVWERLGLDQVAPSCNCGP